MNANTFLTFGYQIWNLQEDFTTLTEFYCFCKTVYFNFFNDGFLNLWFVCNEMGNIQEDGFTSLLMRILKTIFRVSARRFFFFIDVLFSSTKESNYVIKIDFWYFILGFNFDWPVVSVQIVFAYAFLHAKRLLLLLPEGYCFWIFAKNKLTTDRPRAISLLQY